MPVKKHKTHHRVHTEKHKRSKKFLKVYAPYIPLLIMVGLSIFLASGNEFKRQNDSQVLSYATSISKPGLLDSTNQQRMSNGESKLKPSPELTKAAQSKALDMSRNNYWSHTSPSGKEPWYFIQKSGYDYSRAAENLAYGFSSSESTVTGWMNSPSHRKNLLDDSLKEVGFGIVNIPDYQNHGPQTLVVAMYGTPAGASAQTASASKTSGPNFATFADEQKITYIQSITGGHAPWSSFAIGLIFGAAVMYLIFKHLRSLRRTLVKSEKFIIHHPLLDATLISFAALAIILSRTSGFIQ